jgi:NAD(P)H-nitrite reductase large subunit
LWNPAQLQGKTAALNAVGIVSKFEGVPKSHSLKVLGLDIFSIGEFTPSDLDLLFEKETPNGYMSFVIKGNRLAGGIIIGDQRISLKMKQAVENGTEFPPDSDMDSILRSLG